jgi:hypothetical protein
MGDRVEREIEEILAKLDDLPGERKPRTPIPLAPRQKKKQQQAAASPRRPLTDRLNPAMIMISGAVIMLAGLLLASFADPFIWLSFAGVMMFIGAFVLSFFRNPRLGPGSRPPAGVYWRDRYIEYEPREQSLGQRLRRRLRRH